MTGVVVTLIGVALTAAVGLLGVWMNDRAQMRSLVQSAHQALIDELQQERETIKQDLRRLKLKVDALLMERRYWEDYVNMLRAHISDGKPPPPPNYPEGLLRIASEGLP